MLSITVRRKVLPRHIMSRTHSIKASQTTLKDECILIEICLTPKMQGKALNQGNC